MRRFAALRTAGPRTPSLWSRLALEGRIAACVLLGLAVLGALAPNLGLHDPFRGDLRAAMLPPLSVQDDQLYLLGTDRLGRDVLSRLVHGIRVTMSVVLLSTLFSGTVGWGLGMIAGWRLGIVDTIITRLVDAFLAIPSVLIALLFAVVFGASFANVIAVIALVLWVQYARQVRADVLRLRQMPFVALARMAGCPDRTILLRHIAPNTVDSFLVLASVQVSFVIILEASLSFLGVGMPPPAPSWGLMVAEGRSLLAAAWWLSAMPGIAIVVAVLSANALADSLRDALDPRFHVAVAREDSNAIPA